MFTSRSTIRIRWATVWDSLLGLNWFNPRRCKTSLVGQSAGLSDPRSPVRFRAKTPKLENLNFTFKHIELRAKLLDYFLWSNKSNINQSVGFQVKNSKERKKDSDFFAKRWAGINCFSLASLSPVRMKVAKHIVFLYALIAQKRWNHYPN